MLLHLEKENFKEEIKEGKVFVDFYANWCGPCKMLSPVIEELANEHKEIKFIKVDVDMHEELAREYGIMSIPTLILFDSGEIKKKQMGFVPKELLEEWVK